MESRKPKRGRPKSVGGHSSRKKSRDMDDSDQEMREKMEAANVLSSLRFLPPQTKEPNSPVLSGPNVVKVTKIPVTYKMSDPDRGNSMPQLTAPSAIESRPVVKYLSQTKGIARSVVPTSQGVVLSEQANKVILMHLYNSLQNRQTKTDSQIGTGNIINLSSNLPVESIIPKAGDTKSGTSEQTCALPNVLQPSNPVNKVVAAALKNAISGITKIQHPSKPTESSNLSTKHSLARMPRQQTDDGDSEGQEGDKKVENTENTLPLKKRRILPHEEKTVSSSSTISSLFTSQLSHESESDMKNLLRLAQSTQMTSMISETPNKPYAGDGYKPIDPSASLRVLSDVKQALTPDEDGDLPLHIAVVHRNNELVKKFVDIMTMSGKSVDRYNKLMQTPLHLAVLVEEPDIINTLLSSNANPNLVDRNGCTAVHLAVEKGFGMCLGTILEHRVCECELNTRNYEGYTPLHTAVEKDDLGSMVCLVKNGANIDVQDGKAGRSVIYYAVEYDRYEMCQYLQQQGANIDLPNYAGITPVMAAQSTNQQKIMDLFGKGLDGSRLMDESTLSHSSRKLPLPRIPSKASQIVPEEKPGVNSIEDLKSYKIHSPSAPVDLSWKEEAVETNKSTDTIKTENLSNKSYASHLRQKLGTTKYKPAKLVEKHAVLVEQLQSKVHSDPGSYVSLSKEQYNALLSMQKTRTVPSTKADPDLGIIRTNSVDCVYSKEAVPSERPVKSDLTFPLAKTSSKGKADKSILHEDEYKLIEKIKSAKSKGGKEGRTLLSMILDCDLSKQFSEPLEINDIRRPEETLLLSALVMQANQLANKRDELNIKESVSSPDMMKLEKSECSKKCIENSEMPCLSRQTSLASDSDISQGKIEKAALENMEDSKLSQGFDTEALERNVVTEKGLKRSSSRSDVNSEKERIRHDELKQSREESIETEKNDIEDSGKLSGNHKAQEEDSSSVEVQEALPMDEDDDEEVGALVIDEKADVEMKSKDEQENEKVTDLVKNDDSAESSKNTVTSDVESSVSENDDKQLPVTNKDRNSVDSKTEEAVVSLNENTISADKKESCVQTSNKTCPVTADNEHDSQKKENGELVVLEKKAAFYEETVSNNQNKELKNNDNMASEEMMYKVNEKTEWETASLATCTLPPVSKFNHIVKIQEKQSDEKSPTSEILSSPVLSKSEQPMKQIVKDMSKPDKSLPSEKSANINACANIVNHDTDRPSKSNGDRDSKKADTNLDISVNKIGKHIDTTKLDEKQTEHKYIDDVGFQFYLKEKGVKTEKGVTLEHHYLEYKNVEKSILKGVGIIPLEAQNNKEESCSERLHGQDTDDQKTSQIKGPSIKATTDDDDVEKVVPQAVKQQEVNCPNTSTVNISGHKNETIEKSIQEGNLVNVKMVNVSKAHTLYFFDGQNYRSVKVYVDDTEASSEQFKKMFSEKSGLGFGNASVVLSSHSGLPHLTTATIQNVPERLHEAVMLKDENQTNSERAKDDSSVSYGGSRDKTAISLTKTMKSASFDSGRKSQSMCDVMKTCLAATKYNENALSLARKDISKTNVELTANRSLVTEFKSSRSSTVLCADTSDKNLASTVDGGVPHSSGRLTDVQGLSKKTIKLPSDPSTSKILSVRSGMKPASSKPSAIVPRTLSMSSGKSPVMTSEGTLTRINPDIKNRLSKALQSPARKLNITKTDSCEKLIPVSGSAASEVPVTKEGNLRLQI